MKKLPNLPSKLIRVALADVEKVEGMRGYRIDMGRWHGKGFSKACLVCLGGATIVGSKESEGGNAALGPKDFDDRTKGKLHALNSFRYGHIWTALVSLGILDHSLGLPRSIGVTPYDDDPKLFKLDMHKLADILEGAGL